MQVRTQSRDSSEKIKSNRPITWHYTFAKMLAPTKQNQWLMPQRCARTVEDGSKIACFAVLGGRTGRAICLEPISKLRMAVDHL
jgi:hypothetical protein